MRLDFDLDQWQRDFEEIGSKEFPRAVRFALDEVAKEAATEMRRRMPQILGRVRGGKVEASAFTLKAVNYQRTRGSYDDIDGVSELSSAILIAPVQSAFLKYQFGGGVNDRAPGDVGLADDTILKPDNQNLYYCTGIDGVSPFPGARAPKHMMRDLSALIAKGKQGNVSHAEAMKRMGASARSRGAGFSIGPKLSNQPTALGRQISLPGRGTENVPTGARELKSFTKARGIDARGEWRVYRGRDPVSGLTTILAAPPPVRDPQGGYRTFVRPDGTTAKMPKMIGLSRFDGKSGPNLGPRRMLIPTEKARYEPILQGAWDLSAERAASHLGDYMERELANKLERRSQGRRY